MKTYTRKELVVGSRDFTPTSAQLATLTKNLNTKGKDNFSDVKDICDAVRTVEQWFAQQFPEALKESAAVISPANFIVISVVDNADRGFKHDRSGELPMLTVTRAESTPASTEPWEVKWLNF